MSLLSHFQHQYATGKRAERIPHACLQIFRYTKSSQVYMYIHTDMYLHVKYPIQQLAMFRSTQRTRTALVLPEGR